MLIRKPRLLRFIASGLLVQTLTQLAWPTVSYALTAGPTAPEATSFEPVDTTDMVNLTSGDFSYNVPVMEIPGPEGGYPLSLAYHAGIQPDVEASWVGLGWSLNPGAINRNVNGYADDQQSAPQTVRDYWVGGVHQTYRVGVGVGLGHGASVSAGLSFSNDTYRGFGVGEYLSASFGLASNRAGQVGISASLSTDGYGNANAGISIGIGTHGDPSGGASLGVGANVGVSTNFKSVSANAGAGISVRAGGDKDGKGQASNSLLGASISTDGGKFSVRGPGGSSGINNSTAGRIQTQSNGLAFDIPIPGLPAYVELGYDYTRYWSDEANLATVNGALYYPQAYDSQLDLDTQAFDTYRIADPVYQNVVDNPDPDFVRGGSFPDYDNYAVVAQGLGGNMRPYAFQEALYSRNKKSVDESGASTTPVKDVPLPWTNKPMGFRFEGDFSNAYRQENGAVTSAAYTFNTPSYGNADGTYGYDPNSGRLAGSKHIEYYTNAQLLSASGHPGFVDTDAKGFDRAGAVSYRPELAAQIGGFSITNASGVTYHFALPAYAYEEYSRSESLDDTRTFNELTKNNAYAYTWFLTAVTGPDYVDRNTPGLDASDWGYWVKFNYGMWSDHYRWRNPSLGYRSDIDSKIRIYSRGKKEVYYLNSVTTRTHTALFEKELRFDGKGTSLKGFAPSDTTVTTSRGTRPSTTTTINTHEYPANSLRLKRVILLKNADVPANLEATSTAYNLANTNTQTYYYQDPNSHNTTQTNQVVINSQLGFNVIDTQDIGQLGSGVTDKSIRVVAFDYDYSLAPGTPNSIDPTDANAKPGKLTLKSINFLGTQGISILPSTKFDYELAASNKQGFLMPVRDNNNVIFTNQVGIFQAIADANNPSANSYEPGDILRNQGTFTNPNYASYDRYYVVLDLISGSSPTQYHVRCLRASDATIAENGIFVRATKNPPYQSDHSDWWGMYKSDYNATLTGLAEGIARRTTAVSNKGTDAWSLRSITSPIGSKVVVAYEGDQYSKPVLDRPDMVCRIAPYSTPDQATQHPNQQGYLCDNLTLAQLQGINIPNNDVLLNGLVAASRTVASGNINYYKSAFGVAAKIKSIEDASKYSSYYGNRAVIWVQFTNSFSSFWSQGAYISLPKMNTLNEGGGIRVKSVAVSSGNVVRATNYYYNRGYSAQGNTFYLSSGVTSYEPGSVIRIDKDAITSGGVNSGYPTVDDILQYKLDYSKSLLDIFAIAREIPAPGVMYETVTVKENITRADGTQLDAPNAWTYRFKVFKDNMIGHVVSTFGDGTTNRFYGTKVSIKDFTSRIGSLVSTTHYGANGRKLSETVNHFLYDDLDNLPYTYNSDPGPTGYEAKLARFNYQGVIQESFADSRDCLSPVDKQYDHNVVMTKRDVYPTIQTSTTSTDYVTGLSTVSETLGFDFYSGTATRTASTDGYGNRFMTEVLPAYRRYSAMGLKLGNATNRNMLSQVAATTSYKVDAGNNKLAVVGASAQTWSDQVPVIGLTNSDPEKVGTQSGVWRPWQSYAWMPTGTTADGFTPMMGANGFTAFTDASPAPTWRKTSETTLYNAYSNALEAKDIQSVYLATKLGVNQSKVLLSGGPAKYNEIAYTGAEEPLLVNGAFSGRVAPCWPSTTTNFWTSRNETPPSVYTESTPTGKTHTGQSSILVHNNQNGVVYQPDMANLDGTKPYRASVWATTPNAGLYYIVDEDYSKSLTVGGQANRSANGWYLITLDIPSIGAGHTSLRVGVWNGSGQDVYVDDFRFQPVNAQVNAYVYDPLTGQVAYILDNNNLYTHYEYDSGGKLKRVSRETLQFGVQKVAEHSYHLAGALDAVSVEVLYGTATVNVPEAVGTVAITYDSGDGNGYRSLSTATWPYRFPTYFASRVVKVRVQDNLGYVRELVKRFN